MSPRDARAGAYRLHEAPEIAVHDVLGNALRIALAVTRAMNPEVSSPWGATCPLRTKAASLVLAQAESLLCALACYRDVVDCECGGHDDEDDDLPF
jgi:hypothetical protein